VLLFSVVYATAPKALPETGRFEPAPWVVGGYFAKSRSPGWQRPAWSANSIADIRQSIQSE
jgi:hypothetical protein